MYKFNELFGKKDNPNNTKSQKQEQEQTAIPSNGTAKPLGKILPKSKYQQSLEHSEQLNIYERSQKAIEPKPLAPVLMAEIRKAERFKKFYPLVSIATGALFGAFIGWLVVGTAKDTIIQHLGTDFGMGLYYGLIALFGYLGYMFADQNETNKRNNADWYYTPLPENRSQKNYNAMMKALFLSVLISGVGIGFAVFIISDQTEGIEQSTNIAQDSVKTQYQEQIESLNTIISEQKKRQKSSSKWTRYHANNDLQKAEAQKLELLKLQKSDIKEIGANSTDSIKNSKDIALKFAILSAIITLLFELYYLKCFSIVYSNHRKIATEASNHQFGKVEPDTPKPQELTLQDLAVQLLINQLPLNSHSVPHVIGQNVENKTAGFSFSNQATHTNKHEKTALNDDDIRHSIKTEMLERAIRNGVRDYRTLCSLGFNPKQVKTAIKKFEKGGAK